MAEESIEPNNRLGHIDQAGRDWLNEPTQKGWYNGEHVKPERPNMASLFTKTTSHEGLNFDRPPEHDKNGLEQTVALHQQLGNKYLETIKELKAARENDDIDLIEKLEKRLTILSLKIEKKKNDHQETKAQSRKVIPVTTS